MANLADVIEKFILRKLANEMEDIIVLQRNELADELDCAPSQISYVLSTRFTSERGFIVESRRGSGGYIRIARMPREHYQIHDSPAEEVPLADIEANIRLLRDNKLLTAREAALLLTVFQVFRNRIEPGERRMILRSLLSSLTGGKT